MTKKVGKFVYWTPRIVSILFILFLSLFSLDIFDSNLGFWGTIVGLLIHNIPVIILSIVLYISWKKEIVGGIIFIFAGLLYMGIMIRNAIISPAQWYMLSYSLIVAGPAFFIGYLFLLNWFRKSTKS